MRQGINTAILILGFFCLFYYLGMGIFINFRQSMLWLWLLGAAVCFVRWLLVHHSIVTGLPVPLPRWFIIGWRVFLTAGFAFFFFVEGFIVGNSFKKAPPELDAVIVLGAKVNVTTPSGALDQRIRAAEAYLRENPDTLCIASGGQGDDEHISEAACIERELLALGIPGERILTEEASTSTVENLRNSLALLPEGTETVGLVTSDFHMFRALTAARTVGGYEFYGVPARSTFWGYIHYSVREFCALVVSTLEGELRFG